MKFLIFLDIQIFDRLTNIYIFFLLKFTWNNINSIFIRDSMCGIMLSIFIFHLSFILI